MKRFIHKKQRRIQSKKVSIKDTKELLKIRNNNRSNLIKTKLYELPLDIKEKIYKMVIKTHMNEWSFNHLINIRKNLEFLTEKPFDYTENNPNSLWFHKKGKYHYKHLCQRNVKKPHQPGIKGIYIGVGNAYDNSYEEIRYREWINVPNKYWYHEKCRCYMCDRVRLIGINNLPFVERKKYSNIKWDKWSGQWIPERVSKSKKEIKYEKILRGLY